MSNPKAKVTHGGILGAAIDAVADFMIAAKVGIPVPTVDLGLTITAQQHPVILNVLAG